MPRWVRIVAAVCLLAGTSTSFAQTSNDHIPTFDVSQGAIAQVATRPLQQSPLVPVYAVAGLALGSRVDFDSSDYREYKCSPSEQFAGFTWCQKTRQERDRRRSFDVTYSILHSPDGTVVYVNRFQDSAFFGRPNEADGAIRQYSSKIGENAQITRLPPRRGLPGGALATWGKIALELLDSDSINTLAGGKSPKIGYLVDFIGNFARSAKEGLPIFRVSGGAGFLWVASLDQRGRGTLRMAALDPSAVQSTPLPNETQNSTEQATRPQGESTAAQRANADDDVARPEAEKTAEKAQAEAETAHNDSDTAKRDVQLANNEIEKLSAERVKLNATVQQLETERAAAEGKAHTMESVAYGAVVIALLAIVASVLFVNRKMAMSATGQRVGPGTRLSQVIGQSQVVETQATSGGGVSQPSKASGTASSPLELSSTSDVTTAGTREESDVSDSRSTPVSDAAEDRVTLPI